MPQGFTTDEFLELVSFFTKRVGAEDREALQTILQKNIDDNAARPSGASHSGFPRFVSS